MSSGIPRWREAEGPVQVATRDLDRIAVDLNTVARFLARPDLVELTPQSVRSALGRDRADLLVLLGNSVLATVDRAADAFQRRLAATLIVAGGIGHSTDLLRQAVRRDPRYTGCEDAARSEAEIIRDLLVHWHGLDPQGIVLETQSTNCGSNAEEVFRLLQERREIPRDVLLLQDPTMQLRSHASFLRVWESSPTRFFSCPAFIPRVTARNGELAFEADASGQWDMERFISLVLGEIPRLRDDIEGYGPQGRGFIVHVDVPAEIEAAHARLLRDFGRYARATDRPPLP